MALGGDPEDEAHASEHVSPKHTFDFFGLPRELRDLVYDNLLNGNVFSIANFITVRAWSVPDLRHLLINRQFQDEILERSRKCAYVELSDLSPAAIGTAHLPPSLSVTHFEMHFEVAPKTPYVRSGVDECVRTDLKKFINQVSKSDLPFELNLHAASHMMLNEYIRLLDHDLDSFLDDRSKARLTSVKLWKRKRLPLGEMLHEGCRLMATRTSKDGLVIE